MQSKIVGFLLAAWVASCAAKCHLEVGGIAESYLCEGINNLQELITVPASAQRITIVDSRLNTVPGSILAKYAASLVYLNITHSEVNDILPGAFTGLTELQHLVLDYNNIKSIKTSWIVNVPKLRSLHVWHNHITEIEPEVFDHLPYLELLDIAYNQIDHCIPIESLAKLKSLRTLFVTGNPWPLRCRPPVYFHLEHNHVKFVNTWGDSHLFVEECLAHEFGARWNDQVLEKCVTDILAKIHSPASLARH